MDKKILEYRQKHHKCQWCKYYKYVCRYLYLEIASYEECILKDKFIYFSNFPTLCRYYEVKNTEEEENK